MSTPSKRIIIGITGASGAACALKVIQTAVASGVSVHVAVSTMGRRLLFEEAGIRRVTTEAMLGKDATEADLQRITLHGDNDLGATIASGSFQHDGMVIVPCTSNTLGAIAGGMTFSLVQRAATVCLKEHRRLVLAYRESPVSAIDLGNMQTVTAAGGIIAPLSPGFYLDPVTIDDLIDFMAGRLLDLLGVEHSLAIRWREEASPREHRNIGG